MSNNPKVSIIIPIYKVSSTIERCVHSLFSQSFEDIEYIFVDDCSPDDSIAILKKILIKYPARTNAVSIVVNEQNMGISFSRNIGLRQALGKYIIQVDSDDWIEPYMVEDLYVKAIENDADVVYCDFYIDYETKPEKQIYRVQKNITTSAEYVNEILAGNLHGSTWNKLVKRELINKNNIQFPESVTLCEDLYFNIMVLLQAKQMSYLPKAYYHYFQNLSSISNSSVKSSFCSQFEVIRLLQENKMSYKYSDALNLYKARVKSAVFTSGLFSNKEFKECYPESIPYVIQSTSGKLNKIGIKLALNNLYFFARIVIFIGNITCKLINCFRK